MSVTQFYEQAIKPLSSDEKMAIVRLILDESVPVSTDTPVTADGEEDSEDRGFEYLKRILPNIELFTITDEDLASVKLNDSQI